MILGCGVDLIEVGRIERELTRRGGDPFDDLFTADELARCRGCRRQAEAYALGFAAKEALVKALGTGLVGRMAWTDMRIDWSGARPTVALHGETAAAAATMGVEQVHLTAALRRGLRERHAAAWVVLTGSRDQAPGASSWADWPLASSP